MSDAPYWMADPSAIRAYGLSHHERLTPQQRDQLSIWAQILEALQALREDFARQGLVRKDSAVWDVAFKSVYCAMMDIWRKRAGEGFRW